MTQHKEPDPEGDKGDDASLEDVGETCTFCGGSLDMDGDCADPACPGSYHPEDDDTDPDYPEGALGEEDEDA